MSINRQDSSPLLVPPTSYPQSTPSGGLVELLLRSESAARRLERELRTAIVKLELPPGTRLTEQDIAVRYGVSRQPVREAFISLDRAGLLSVRAQRGTMVVRISRERMKAARFVREAIEVAVARRACVAFDISVRHEIEDLFDLQKRAAARADRDNFTQLDEAFHQALTRGCGMPSVWETLADIKSHMDRVCHLTIPDADSMQPLVDQHRAIVVAIDAKDADAADAAMRLHLTEILRAMPKAEAANPDLFE
jgi:GntR family transcriptional regulator, rspAB operon transcriptional repressor